MKKNRSDMALQILGAFLVILGIAAYYVGFTTSGIVGVLWFSYSALLIIGIGILTKNSYLIGSQINIIFIPYFIWNLDFFSILILNNGLFGIVDYVFTPRPLLDQIISLQHIFIVPVGLAAFYLTKMKRTDFWKFSLIQISIFYLLIKLLTEGENINCVLSSCLPLTINFLPYTLTWFAANIGMILITNFLLVKSKRFINKKFL